MRAAVLEAFDKPLAIREFDDPRLEPGQILVKMLAAGVCGSDIHMWRGKDPRTPLPTILGHEGVGEVVEIGGSDPVRSISGREFHPGDRIIWDRGVTCGHCYYCAVKHEPNLCPSRWAYGIGRSSANPPYLVGCYADHMVLDPKTVLLHVDEFEGASYPVMAGATCSGATAANAVELAEIQPGDSVLVQGSGPLGLFLTAFAKGVGARTVAIVGGSPDSLHLALKLGADITISYRSTSAEDRAELIRQHMPEGVDVVLESAGTPDSITEGIAVLRRGGAYISTGFAIPGANVTLDCYNEFVRKHLRLQGSWCSHTRHLKHSLSLVCANPEPFAEMYAKTFPLEQATQALEAMENRETIKSAIVF